jgi:hypothetical protein
MGYAMHLMGKALRWDKTAHAHFPAVESPVP